MRTLFLLAVIALSGCQSLPACQYELKSNDLWKLRLNAPCRGMCIPVKDGKQFPARMARITIDATESMNCEFEQ